jgi:CHU_C Type IX secretion signal domain
MNTRKRLPLLPGHANHYRFFQMSQHPPSNITIPNTFTPNGDGINDTWVISGIDKITAGRVLLYHFNQ